MSSKALQIAKEIDLARCNGNWSALPELGRRYKKYNPEGAILEQTIVAENSLVQVLNTTRAESVTYDSDTPLSISIETRVQPEQVRSIQNQLRAAIQLSDPNNVNHAQKELVLILNAVNTIKPWR
ncbi:hypothetical protein K501DRAFT_6050 [Backusella circina FSU 941]|nr:hypothetical protein K501DRAFT_6050 [Backusella circina FSU 941]